MDFGQCAFSGLDEADAVLGILGRTLEAADLGAHLLGNRETRGVVAGAVDLVAGGKLLKVLVQGAAVGAEVAIAVHRRNVVLNTHCNILLNLFSDDPSSARIAWNIFAGVKSFRPSARRALPPEV